jgi:hypothetical protein
MRGHLRPNYDLRHAVSMERAGADPGLGSLHNRDVATSRGIGRSPTPFDEPVFAAASRNGTNDTAA